MSSYLGVLVGDDGAAFRDLSATFSAVGSGRGRLLRGRRSCAAGLVANNDYGVVIGGTGAVTRNGLIRHGRNRESGKYEDRLLDWVAPVIIEWHLHDFITAGMQGNLKPQRR